MRPEGHDRTISGLNPEALAAINKSLSSRPSSCGARREARKDPAVDRILASFVVDGRLQKIPEAHTKRQVVLQWVLDHLEDRRYKEREISDILKRYFDDNATLRRELMNHRLMKRETGSTGRCGRSCVALSTHAREHGAPVRLT
jgi:hypothetical protein